MGFWLSRAGGFFPLGLKDPGGWSFKQQVLLPPWGAVLGLGAKVAGRAGGAEVQGWCVSRGGSLWAHT